MFSLVCLSLSFCLCPSILTPQLITVDHYSLEGGRGKHRVFFSSWSVSIYESTDLPASQEGLIGKQTSEERLSNFIYTM